MTFETAYGTLTVADTPDVQLRQQAGEIVAYAGSGYAKGMIVVRGVSETFATSFVLSTPSQDGIDEAVRSIVRRLTENGYRGAFTCR